MERTTDAPSVSLSSGPPTYEEIVRCKDCKHFTHNKEFWFKTPGIPIPLIGATSDCCDFWADTECKVTADGFCAWGERRDDMPSKRRASSEIEELRRACTQLRWMLGADRCIRCDEACEDLGRCLLDERLASLGVTVPLRREVGHVSQCEEDDERES